MASSNSAKVNELTNALIAAEARISELQKKITEVETQRTKYDEAIKYVNDNLPTIKQAANDVRTYKETTQSTVQDAQSLVAKTKEVLVSLKSDENKILGE